MCILKKYCGTNLVIKVEIISEVGANNTDYNSLVILNKDLHPRRSTTYLFCLNTNHVMP